MPSSKVTFSSACRFVPAANDPRLAGAVQNRCVAIPAVNHRHDNGRAVLNERNMRDDAGVEDLSRRLAS